MAISTPKLLHRPQNHNTKDR
uniref:Uncharacterized protein n=1 Tax=Arundo donax TaxID=35708 RepID=A0A0A8Z9P9_ARUDO